MLIYGPNLGMPHTKPLKNSLFELRMKKNGDRPRFLATHLSRDILKAFYVDKLLAVPQFKGFQEPLF